MKIITFALWGNDARYISGALENVRLAKTHYPGWELRFYCSENVSSVCLGHLKDGGQVIMKPACDNYLGLYWRLEPGYEEGIERFIVRDCDSRLNKREAAAVKDWESTQFPFHIMRDHFKYHGATVMGGMFGMIPGSVPDYQKNLLEWVENIKPNNAPLGQYWGLDQEFLRKKVWPHVIDNHLAHDDSRRKTRREKRFRVKLPKGQFVGQRFDHNNQPEYV